MDCRFKKTAEQLAQEAIGEVTTGTKTAAGQQRLTAVERGQLLDEMPIASKCEPAIKKNVGVCTAPTQPFRAALGAESRVCNSRQANSMSAHVLLPLAVNSKLERKVNSLPPLGFELVIIGMLAHLSKYSTKSHPQCNGRKWFTGFMQQ
jgi:hypothetical protein